MLWTIAVILVVMWLLGMVTTYTLGGFIHVLLILAIIAVLVRVIQGESPVTSKHTEALFGTVLARTTSEETLFGCLLT